MHSWIALELIWKQKLVRSQLNTQILSYSHFFGEKAHLIMAQVCCNLRLEPNYSKSRASQVAATLISLMVELLK